MSKPSRLNKLVIFLTLSLSCQGAIAGAKHIKDIDARSAEACEFLGQVTATKYSGMLFAGAGLKGAQNKVRKKAAKLGASHVQWGPIAAGGAIQAASATAYLCQ